MATYRVEPGTYSVAPVKAEYTTDESVGLRIRCKAWRKNGLGWLVWTTIYEVYDNSGVLLAEDERRHNVLTTLDSAEDDFVISLGRFEPGKLEGYVVVKAHG